MDSSSMGSVVSTGGPVGGIGARVRLGHTGRNFRLCVHYSGELVVQVYFEE